MKKIKISKGYFAIVDDDLYNVLNQYNWQSHLQKGRVVSVLRGKWVALDNGTNKLVNIQMSRVVLNMFDKKYIVDHINNNPLDNRRINLRVCTKRENAINRKPLIGKKSPYKGVTVYFSGRKEIKKIKYLARLKQVTIGSFDNEKDAAIAYNKAAIFEYGKYAKLNKI